MADSRLSDAALLAVMQSMAALCESEDMTAAITHIQERAPSAEDAAAAIVAADGDEIVRLSDAAPSEPDVARGMLDALDEHENTWEPAKALVIATAAECLLLRADTSIAHLEFRAIKEQANALRLLGRFDDALRAIDRAETVARRTAAIDLHIAIAMYCRAAVLCESQRTCDAATLLARARSVFVRYHDAERIEKSTTFEATILYQDGRYADAIALYNAALMRATERGDLERSAKELGNIGHCCTMLGELTAARGYFDVASDMYSNIGMPVQSARLQRSLARIEIRETECADRFDDAAAEFESLGMIGEWSLTRMALAEELHSLDPQADIAAICREVFTRASEAGIRGSAAEALAMLADCAHDRDMTPTLIHRVMAGINQEACSASAPLLN